jgi:Fe-S oxidoreductase
MLTIKLRDHAYERYPLFARKGPKGSNRKGMKDPEEAEPLVGSVIRLEEIWSCTTCGACEEECPVFIEYIDKIVDMRRHLIESAENPKGFNSVLMHVEKTGNPFGKPSAKRGDWAKEVSGPPIRVLKPGEKVDVLYFVDGYGSYDPRVQSVARAISRGLRAAGVDFGILGPLERDSGHQVRRLGEEGLFQVLMEENRETLTRIRFNRIVTTDPHALNCLKKDYGLGETVRHYTQYFCSLLESGRIKPGAPPPEVRKVTYHDPCYLGRHNGVYDEPRKILEHIPGIERVEMKRSRDRSFCCGGGDVGLWHEIEGERVRMAARRMEMALETGADTVVTACPFCLIHLEDAIKTQGLERDIRAVDLMEFLMLTMGEV